MPQDNSPRIISITPLLTRLWPSPSDANVTAEEIAQAISYIFTDQLSPVQTGALLTCLNFTGWDRRADVIAKCAQAMREAAVPINTELLQKVVKAHGKPRGKYEGGLCDIVGTGGDSHHTFNISTTASILASSLLLIGKHGNRASTSKSGSADLLCSMQPTAPDLGVVGPNTIAMVYEKTNYAFLFAPVFHLGMKYVAPIRKELGWRTIFNLLGPLANPVDAMIEARLIGVARRDLGPVFAEALLMSGAKKAMIICGEEDIDEISCAGKTYCWSLKEKNLPTSSDGENAKSEIQIEHFNICAADFGLSAHALQDACPGKDPHENAVILKTILEHRLPRDDPLLEFVLMNTAALFVVSGICESDTTNLGFGDDGKVITERGPGGGRWKEGVRLARWAIESGEAWRQWRQFVEVTCNL